MVKVEDRYTKQFSTMSKIMDEMKSMQTYLEQQLNMLHGMYDTVKDELKPEALDLIHNQIGPEQIAYIMSNKPMRFQARWFYKKMKGDTVALFRYTLWEISRATFRLIKRNRKSWYLN
jgi:hypothetical protein